MNNSNRIIQNPAPGTRVLLTQDGIVNADAKKVVDEISASTLDVYMKHSVKKSTKLSIQVI